MEYFPGVVWPPDLCNPENLSHGRSTLLRGMGEEPLPRGPAVRTYRVSAQFTWGRPCTIRLDASGSGWQVTGLLGTLLGVTRDSATQSSVALPVALSSGISGDSEGLVETSGRKKKPA